MSDDEEMRDSVGDSVVRRPLKKRFANFSMKERKPTRKTGVTKQHSLDEEQFRDRSWSESSRLQVIRKASRPASVEVMGVFDDIRNPLRAFLATQTCYDLIPHIGNVILFDKGLTIRYAFATMLEKGLQSCPIWDRKRQRPVDVLTQTDFIDMLRLSNEANNDDADQETIDWWLNNNSKPVTNFAILPENLELAMSITENLQKAAEFLVRRKIHRAPVFRPNSYELLSFISLKQILRLVQKQLRNPSVPLPLFMQFPIGRLKELGTWDDIISVTYATSLSCACEHLVSSHVSSLPIIDRASGRLTGVLTKTDILALLNHQILTVDEGKPSISLTPAARTGNGEKPSKNNIKPMKSLTKEFLNRTVGDLMEAKQTHFPATSADLSQAELITSLSVDEGDNLTTVTEKLGTVGGSIRSVFIVDTLGRPIGVISISDVLDYIIRQGQDPSDLGINIGKSNDSLDHFAGTSVASSSTTSYRSSVDNMMEF